MEKWTRLASIQGSNVSTGFKGARGRGGRRRGTRRKKEPAPTCNCRRDYQVEAFKARAKNFYFEVLLSQYRCPKCDSGLEMTGNIESECRCTSCGRRLDPTIEFQQSLCCGARLVKRTFHYACARCRRTVPSRFLFDERVFDRDYFREMMWESRERVKRKKEEVRRLLMESRSGALTLESEPDLETIPGLLGDLDAFICSAEAFTGNDDFDGFEAKKGFDLDRYRDHIMSVLSWHPVLFSQLEPVEGISADTREDRVGRFVALIYMDHGREIDLSQHGTDIMIQKVQQGNYDEAHG
jgi:DNA-directed RNA polymerase subunit RPC12/RpoP